MEDINVLIQEFFEENPNPERHLDAENIIWDIEGTVLRPQPDSNTYGSIACSMGGCFKVERECGTGVFVKLTYLCTTTQYTKSSNRGRFKQQQIPQKQARPEELLQKTAWPVLSGED